ncbi:YaeC family lipoprotein [Bradyrhizobium sp. AZCC 2262]|uniref:MetQ/NlpA family ABC transporter substrate-binding protein n=1 Tax=Bradyrhizobium sp. AZCC 2262 TaxID=3117022 RepID=UPI003035DED9
MPGPYIDEFKAGVAPELQKKGYRIRYVEFSTGLEANNAVFKNEIDANVMQHTIFLNSYNERQQTDLVGIVHVPTPPMGLYSKKHPPGTAIKHGSTVAVPNDPVNLQRSLWILRDLGLIEIRDSKPIDVSELDVIKNPGNIKIVPLEAAQAPRALDDVDFAAIPGKFCDLQRVEAHQRLCAGEDDDALYQRGGRETRQRGSPVGAGYWRGLQVADFQDGDPVGPLLRRLCAAGLSQMTPVQSVSHGHSRYTSPAASLRVRSGEAVPLLLLAAAALMTAGTLVTTLLQEQHDPALVFAAFGAGGMPMISHWTPTRCHAATVNSSAMRLDHADLLALLERK